MTGTPRRAGATAQDGLMLEPGAGRRILGGGVDATVKIPGTEALMSTLEVVVAPGFDVGAHLHAHSQEMFYVVEGELDILAFEPVERTGDWHDWRSPSGRTFLRGGPGSLLFVPPGCPHAFANFTDVPVRMLFQASPVGHELHEDYLRELSEVLGDDRRGPDGAPDQDAVADLRRRYDMELITDVRMRVGQPGLPR